MPPPPRAPRDTPSPWAKEGLGGWAVWPLFRCAKGPAAPEGAPKGRRNRPNAQGRLWGRSPFQNKGGDQKSLVSQAFFAFLPQVAASAALRTGCRKSGLRHFFEVFIAPLRLRRGQGAMQRNPCYARLFADLPYTPPNPIIASGGCGPRTPKGFSTGWKKHFTRKPFHPHRGWAPDGPCGREAAGR